MATSARRSISLSSLRRRAENSTAFDILLLLRFSLALLVTRNRKQILRDHAPAHITLESRLSLIAGSPHRERIFQMADGPFTAGAPAQGSLKPTFFLPFCALVRQTPPRRQGHLLDSQSLRLLLVLGGEKSAVRGGHLRSTPKASSVVLDGWQPRVRVGCVSFQNFVTAHDAIFHFVDAHQPTKLVGLMRLSLADHLRMRLKQAQHFPHNMPVSSPHPLFRLRHHLFY